MAHEKLRSLRPTPSMAVAITALVFAASGGAYAAAGGPVAHATAVASHAKAAAAKKKKKPTGPRGPRGARGARGPVGPAGSNGSNGAKGANGATGATGAQGIQGLTGAAGAAGPAGAAGAAGSSQTLTWLAPAVPTGPGGALGTTGVVKLMAVGPFTILGKCTTNGANVFAQNYISTSQPNSMESDNTRADFPVFSPTTVDTVMSQAGGQNVTGDVQIGPVANNVGVPQFLEGPRGNATAAMSADGLTFLTAFTSSGVIGSGTTATCFFAGNLVRN
jgi:Collagen triple helix repeat (20 copies)